MARSPERSCSLMKWFLVFLAVMYWVHGKPMNSTKIKGRASMLQREECPTLQDSSFPDSMIVRIGGSQSYPDIALPQDPSNRSLSPWDYRINEDPNRIPSTISEANCRYNACVSTTGWGQNYGLNSVPIQQEILVLKRKQAGCRRTYQLERQMVTVGCTCAFPITQTNTNLRKDDRTTRI